MIYFIACPEANAIKIGIVAGGDYHLFKRLSTLQSGCPLKLEVVAVQDGHIEEERELIARFAEHRVHGEWFRFADEIREHISGLEKPAKPSTRPYTCRTRLPRWAA